MKKKLSFLFLMIGFMYSFSNPVNVKAEQNNYTPVYRLYCPTNGEHLYTTDVNERNVLYKDYGWGYEGVGWYTDETGTPVYRLYNPILKNHLYTTDSYEVEVLTSKHGWVKDNNGKPLFYSSGYVAIYRVYNEKLNGMHHLTTDYNEYVTLPKFGWGCEGIKLLAEAKGTPVVTQFYPKKLPSTPVSLKPEDDGKTYTIENNESNIAIEADVTLQGTGTGCHAKLVLCTPTSAVSFGIQYDKYAESGYAGKAMCLIENIASNSAGGQAYSRPSNKEVGLGETHRMMISLNNDGSGAVYLDQKKIGTFNNPNLKDEVVYLRVEASARKNGDMVEAKFDNIKIKKNMTYNPNKSWGTYEFESCPTINATVNSWDNIEISGVLSGIDNNSDWDSEYESVSGIIQFTE